MVQICFNWISHGDLLDFTENFIGAWSWEPKGFFMVVFHGTSSHDIHIDPEQLAGEQLDKDISRESCRGYISYGI